MKKTATGKKRLARWYGRLRYIVNGWRWFARLRCLVGWHPWNHWQPFTPLGATYTSDMTRKLTVAYYQLRLCRRRRCHAVQVRANPEPFKPSFQGDESLQTKYRGNVETLFGGITGNCGTYNKR